MAENFLTRAANRFMDRLGLTIASDLSPERVEELTKQKQYYENVQKPPLKTKPGQANDNLVTNFVALAVDRANSMLFGGGVEFMASAGADSAEQKYLDDVWDANKKPILLHRTGQDGEVFGTPFVKIVPDALEGEDGKLLPRIVLLDTRLMTIHTDPMDIERVIRYVFEIQLEDHGFREVTRRADEDELLIDLGNGFSEAAPPGSWIVETFETAYGSGQSTAWTMTSQVLWAYPFPPIIHWQNLPSLHSVYGLSGIAGVIDIQDKYNFVVSNILKVLRYHAHPKTWGRGIPAGTEAGKVSWGGDEMLKFTSETAQITNLEMQSDLASSRNVAQDLRQTIFAICRVVDIDSVADKVGALTNFGLRVLYSDALAKNSTRRALYGDALEELNRRLLLLANFTNPKNVAEWGSDLPQDENEDAKLVRDDLLAGLVSVETASELRGYQWKTDPDNPENLGEEDLIKQTNTNTGDAEALALSRLFAGTTTP